MADEREHPDTDKQGRNSEVGRGKPPVEHQFKPGQSGNPGGRPKGSGSLKTRARQLLRDGLDGKDIADALVRVGMQHALKGDHRFWKEMWELIHDGDGEPTTQPTDEAVDAVAFPSGAIPSVPQPDAVQDDSRGEAVGEDGTGEAEADG